MGLIFWLPSKDVVAGSGTVMAKGSHRELTWKEEIRDNKINQSYL